VAGGLGSFTWDGVTSDAPWIVPRRASPLDAARRLRVRFVGAPAVTGWTARWARVVDGLAGNPRTAGSGGASIPLDIEDPPRPGDWSLQVDVRFDGGGRATWYWRLQVDP
jgi:hypothetical protein